MSIHRLPSGYRVRWRKDSKLRSKNFRRKVDAERFQNKLIEEHQNSDKQVALETSKLTFEELAEYWIENYAEIHKAPSSIILDKQQLRDHIIPTIGKIDIDAVKSIHITKIQAYLVRENTLSIKTINLVISLIYKIFEDAILWEFCNTNPCKGIRPLKQPAQDFSFWTLSERDEFLTYAKKRNFRVYEIVAVAVHTGMRKGEMEGLLRDTLDFNRKEILVKRSFCQKTKNLNEYTKGKNIRRIPMNPFVYEILVTRKNLFDHQKIFEFDFMHLSWRYFKPIQQALGISAIRFHDLRHTFASHLAMSGVSMFDIQQLLGHRSIHTTQRYMHLAPDHLSGKTDILMPKREEHND